MSKLTRENALLPFQTNVDLTAYIGCAVLVGPSPNGATAELWMTDEKPFGVIVHADPAIVTVAPFHGGVAGTFKVKILDETSPGRQLCLVDDNGTYGFADASEQNFPGETFICAVAVESGVAGEMIEAIPTKPESLTIA